MKQPPKWLQKAVKHYVDLFRLNLWSIRYSVDPTLNGSGEARSDARYFRAELVFTDLDEPNYRLVCHEVLHVLAAEMDHAVENQIIAELVPESHRNIALEIYTQVNERLIETLAIAISELSTPQTNKKTAK